MKIHKHLLITSIVATLTAHAQTPDAAPAAQEPAPAAATPTSEPLIPLSGWSIIHDKTKTYGPKEENGSLTFSGPGYGDKGKNGAGYFTKTELTDGSSLEFTARVTFSCVSGMGNFRFGLFQKKSRDHTRGWLGYCAYAGIDKKFPKGGLFASEASNDTGFDAATSRVLGESLVPFKNIKDGNYDLNMKLTRAGASIEVQASLVPEADPATPTVRYAGTDSTPTTFAFDAFGFSTHELLSADSIQFSKISLKFLKK